MTFDELLREIFRCIVSNGGGRGGNAAVDSSAEKSFNGQPLTSDDRERLLNTTVGYFYANMPHTFDENRDSLWRCLSKLLGKDPNSAPEPWLLASTSILGVVSQAL